MLRKRITNHNMDDADLFSGMDAIILCGGLGTRLRSAISDRPKVLAPFGNETFLDILVGSLKNAGFRRFILCTGYMKDQIARHFASRHDISVVFSEEVEPLGTGGALKNAKPHIYSPTFLVLNGDSICNIRYPDFYRFHREHGSVVSLALVTKNDTGDYGNVTVDASSRISSFKEKVPGASRSLVNAGIYFMEHDIFSFFPDKTRFSLENDVFPRLVGERCAGFIIDSELIDIGTPDRYQMALQKIQGGT